MNTYFGLLAEFGTAHIPLDQVATKYFGMDVRTAKRLAASRQLPVAAIRLGSHKSPWLVPADELAKYIDTLKAEANRETHGAAHSPA